MNVSALSENGLVGGYSLLASMEALRRKHPDTYYHCIRVSLLAEKFADFVEMDKREARDLVQGCFVHDIGKLLIDNAVLDNQQLLRDDGTDAMKEHPQLGVRLLDHVMNERLLATVRHQNEYWDGSGRPRGLAADQIPKHARICAIADIFDSWVMPGSRYPNRSVAAGMNELRRLAGIRLDPGLVDRFLRMLRKPGALYMYCTPGAGAPDDG